MVPGVATAINPTMATALASANIVILPTNLPMAIAYGACVAVESHELGIPASAATCIANAIAAAGHTQISHIQTINQVETTSHTDRAVVVTYRAAM